MKRFFSVILLLFMLITAGCTSAVTKEPIFFPEKNDKLDLSGEEFTIVSSYASESAGASSSLFYKENTAEADWAKARLDQVASKYNCGFNFATMIDDVDDSTFFTKLIAGTYVGDIILAASKLIRYAGDAGLLEPIANYSQYIDYRDSNKWGTPNAQEQLMCNGVLCGVVPNLWPSMQPYSDYPIIFNDDLMKSNGIADLREYYETGVWTWDKLLEVVNTCTHVGIGTDDVYGMATYDGHLLRAALMSNGVTAVMQDAEGNYISGYTTSEAEEAISWVNNIYLNESSGFWELSTNGTPWGPCLDTFMGKKAAMLLTRQYDIYNTIQWDMNFGIMPFPVGPSGKVGTAYGYFETGASISIPITAPYPEFSAILINDIFEPFEGMTTAEDVAKYTGKNVFQDERDITILRDMADGSHYSFWVEGGDDTLWNYLNGGLGVKTAAQIIDEIKNKKETYITEQVIPMYENHDKYYG